MCGRRSPTGQVTLTICCKVRVVLKSNSYISKGTQGYDDQLTSMTLCSITHLVRGYACMLIQLASSTAGALLRSINVIGQHTLRLQRDHFTPTTSTMKATHVVLGSGCKLHCLRCWYGAEVVLLMQKGRSVTIEVPGVGLDEMLSEAGKTAGWSFSPSCPLHYTTAS